MGFESIMENNRQNINKERRTGADRRNMIVDFDFPFVDSHGQLVTEDRRQSERRETPSRISDTLANLDFQSA